MFEHSIFTDLRWRRFEFQVSDIHIYTKCKILISAELNRRISRVVLNFLIYDVSICIKSLSYLLKID